MYKQIIGIDFSLRATGLVILDEGGELVRSEVVRSAPSKQLSHIVRKARLADAIFELSGAHPGDTVIFEQYAFSAKGHIAEIAEAKGMLLRRFMDDAVVDPNRIIVATPQMLKKFASGKGNADKNVVMKAVFKRWGFDTDNDNVADAFTLAKIAHALHSGCTDLTKYEKEVIEKLRSMNPLYEA